MKAMALAAAACLALLAVFAGFAWRGARSRHPHPRGLRCRVRPARRCRRWRSSVVASQTGLETMPSLSPDGKLAYTMSPAPKRATRRCPGVPGKAIYVQTTAAVAPRHLTEPPSGMRDGAPHWSPDGRQILFLRASEHGSYATCWWSRPAAARHGRPACLLQSTGVYDWLPDGSGIIAGGMQDEARHRGAPAHPVAEDGRMAPTGVQGQSGRRRHRPARLAGRQSGSCSPQHQQFRFLAGAAGGRHMNT